MQEHIIGEAHTFCLQPSATLPLDRPSSRVLRSVTNLGGLVARLRRGQIQASTPHAALREEVFHLRRHPHNFGAHMETNLAQLDQLLDHFEHLRMAYGMHSLGIAELARSLSA